MGKVLFSQTSFIHSFHGGGGGVSGIEGEGCGIEEGV